MATNAFGDEIQQPLGGGVNAFGDPITGASPLGPRRAKDLSDAVIAGLQSSALGLALRGKMPSQQLGEDAPWYHRLASGAAGAFADIPLNIIGGVAGMVAGAPAGPVGSAVGGGAGAFAVPMALRDALMEAYSQNHAASWKGVWDITLAALKGGAKGAVIGGVTGGAGLAAKGVMGTAAATTTGRVFQGAGTAGTELAAMTTSSAALEGHMPTLQDFADNAVLLGGFKAANHVAKGMYNVYRQTGKGPSEIVGDAAANPSVTADLARDYAGLERARENNTFVGQAPAAGRQVGMTQPKGTPVDKLFSNFADGMTPDGVTEFRGKMFDRANQDPKQFAKDAVATTDMPFGEGLIARIDAAKAGNTRVQILEGDTVLAAARVQKGMFDSVAVIDAAKGRGIGADLVRFLRREQIANVEEVPDRSPGYVKVQKAVLAEDVGLPTEPGLPAFYEPMALAERIKNAIDAEPRPEALRSAMQDRDAPPKLGTPGEHDPVKYEYITDSDTLKGVLPQLEALYKPEIDAQTRDVVPDKEAAARGLKMAVAGDVAEHIIGTAENAEMIRARGHVLGGFSVRAFDLMRKLHETPEGEQTPLQRLEALSAIEQLAMAVADFRGARAEAGRALRAYRAMKNDGDAFAAEALVKLYEQKGNLSDVARMVADMKDPAQLQKFAEGYVKAEFKEQVIEAWKAGLVSGPMTHIANIMGNVGKFGVDLVEKPVAATLFAIDRAVKNDPISWAQWRARAFSPITGLSLAVKDGLHVASSAYRTLADLPAKGMTRVYRGETTLPRKDIPDWIKQGLKESGSLDAQGRWWTKDPEIAKWYRDDAAPNGRVVYQDVPSSVVEASRVSGLDAAIKKFSLDADNELFLPKEFVGQGREAPPSLGERVGSLAKAGLDRLEQGDANKGEIHRPAIPGVAGQVVRAPFTALQIMDLMFRTVGERAQAHILAVDRSVKGGFHPETKEGRERIALYLDNPEYGLAPEAAKAARQAIEQAGSESVFSQKLGKRMQFVQLAMQGTTMQFVVPFFRTPVNLLSWAVQHTPALNLLSSRWREDWSAGGERQQNAVARVVVGLGLTTMAYSLAESGLLTGGGIFDQEQRGAKEAAGIQKYSLKIGDKYYSYQRMEPVAKVLGMAADLIELQKNLKDDDDKAKVATMLVAMFGNATVSTTYLSGLSNAINATTDPERYSGAFLEQYASSLVPKIIGQTAQLTDSERRQVDSSLDAIQSQIPFLREKLLPARDVWGEPKQNDRWFDFMPVATSTESHDKVKTEAVRLQLGIAGAPKFLFEKGPLKSEDERLKLTPEQRDVVSAVSGRRAMEILSPIVNSEDWKNIPDFAKVAIYKNVIAKSAAVGKLSAVPADAIERETLRSKIIEEVMSQINEAQGVKK